MRVISGKFKSHSLKSVPHSNTRPTTDKVKEALFHFLGPYFDGGKALDLFAGSGNLGIEGLSRGMDHVTFVDKDSKAIKTIHENIKLLGIAEKCEVFRNDAFRALKAASNREKTFDYVFLDPPYGKISYSKLLHVLNDEKLLNNGAIVICEHAYDDKLNDLPQEFQEIKQDAYSKSISITILQYDLGGN
ncbi:16S rRNA (guanine(966)-N(2))-methyltransferase RsmD [Halalkalibacillus sediminis]|uniref:16S rRNA (Guanine(966)-N(2))-methyltransferase RsmD n=1 Tax=Halalkalibacillus sediminis TaxID=2018042 RepID=A0A2I0QW06_9BACI|nr:16S rRNA (guanine(966)-N(2))-methyltransferase RsmD [Halalkalibacillus sediminis]PKR78516.1 16S rRNA (guanine(966)-N(2))-methyltransferase RsmD [Halalkalibacillus sediminis]